MVKSKLELLGELLEEKEKALLAFQVQNQERSRKQPLSSFGLNASHVEAELSALTELEAEVQTLRNMYTNLAAETGQEIVGTREQIADFMSKKDDNCLYKLILIRENTPDTESEGE